MSYSLIEIPSVTYKKYLPSDNVVSSFSDYLNTLGELEGFIESQHCDSTLVAGDFNVDFDHGGPLASLLEDFASDQNFVVCDLSSYIACLLGLTCLIIFLSPFNFIFPAPQSIPCLHLSLPNLKLA